MTAFVRASFARQQPQKKIDSCSICHETYQPQGASTDKFVVKPPEGDVPPSWLRKGTFKTTPTSHASCFNCHWQDGGEKPLSTDCAGCHKLLPEGKTGVFVPRDHLDPEPVQQRLDAFRHLRRIGGRLLGDAQAHGAPALDRAKCRPPAAIESHRGGIH